MKTRQLTIKSVSDEAFLLKKRVNYSCAFHAIFKALHKLDDDDFVKYIYKKFQFTDIEFRSLVSDVKTKFEQIVTDKAKKEAKIVDVLEQIQELKKLDKSKKVTRQIFKKNRKPSISIQKPKPKL